MTKGNEKKPAAGAKTQQAAASHLLKGEKVETRKGHLLQDNGERLTPKQLRVMMRKVQAKARLKDNGALHILRHTYCSHLAMAGVPVMEIQRLAGHAHLTTTLKYMHLSPGSEQREAVAKLDRLRANQHPGPRNDGRD